MKKVNIYNLLCIFSFVILLLILTFNVVGYIKNDRILRQDDNAARKYCDEIQIDDSVGLEKCKLINDTPIYKTDFYSMTYSVFSQGFSVFTYVIFFIITIPFVYAICNAYKNGVLTNLLTRKSYKGALITLFFDSAKTVFILPVIAIIAFIVCYLYTGNFDFNNALNGGFVSWSAQTMQSPVVFMFVYIFRVLCLSIGYLNIAFCVCKKQHNFFVASIVSYLIFIAIELFLELFCNVILLQGVFGTDIGVVLNIISVFSLFDYYGLIYSLLIPFIVVLLTFGVVVNTYWNKESLLIECEKSMSGGTYEN